MTIQEIQSDSYVRKDNITWLLKTKQTWAYWAVTSACLHRWHCGLQCNFYLGERPKHGAYKRHQLHRRIFRSCFVLTFVFELFIISLLGFVRCQRELLLVFPALPQQYTDINLRRVEWNAPVEKSKKHLLKRCAISLFIEEQLRPRIWVRNACVSYSSAACKVRR